jgi:Zn-dependent M28 family amino/carboxypeptidase
MVLLGAHYDHLGRGDQGSSLAGAGEAGQVHHGADDNASGVAAVLEAAALLRAREREAPVAFAFWSGEELGLLGSGAFVASGVLPPERLLAYLNFDMVGRSVDDALVLQATGTSGVWPRLIEQTNVPLGFALQTSEDPWLPTDVTSFNQVKVPSLNFFTGSHSEYHRPADTADRLNYDALARIARFGALVAEKLSRLEEAPQYVEVERSQQGGGSRDTVRAFTGTIPDYATEVEGLLLSGVVAGGPAEEAGLRGGDVIVEFAGQTVANIYDYTYALDVVKIDQPVGVVYLRDGERHQTTLTPRARR